MQSIFVWNAPTPCSGPTLRCMLGSDWYMEEHATGCKTFQYHTQTRVEDAMVWEAESKSDSWMGSLLLETVHLPYQLIKKDGYATLEQIGGWMRCTLSSHVERDALMDSYHTIKSWIHSTKRVESVDDPCLIIFPPFRLSPDAPSFTPMMKKAEFNFHETKKRR